MMIDDLRLAVRQLQRAPGFAAAAALTLALGIGANTAIFSILNDWLRPLPARDPDRIVVVAAALPGDETGLRYRFSYPALEDYRREAAAVFSDVFGFDLRIGGLTAAGRPAPFIYHLVTGNFFSALGLTPAAGRLFAPGEGERPGAEPRIVLGHGCWLRRFGGDPAVVGRSVRLNGEPARIIGVAPAGFRGLIEGAEMDGFVPLGAGRAHDPRRDQFFTDRSIRPLTMVARLQPGATIEQAQAAVDSVAARLAARHPDTERGATARVMPERLARPLPLPFLMNLLPLIRTVLYALSGIVLLIACMNVANLLLVRATERERELAVRASLGAGRGRLMRLLLVESLLLACLGTAVGLVLGAWLRTGLVGAIDIGADVPLRLDAPFDWRVFGYAAATALASAVFVGLLPALRASRPGITGLLHDGGRAGSAGVSRQRARSLLVVAQVAASLVLLVVAGLAVRSLLELQRIDPGFAPAGVLTGRLDTHHVGYDPAQSESFYRDLEDRLLGIPGVESASLSFTVPLSYILGGYVAFPEGDVASDTPRPAIGANTVTPAYFDTMRIPIVRGRAFDARDARDAPRVVIVNEALAARFWPARDPLGQRLVIPVIGGLSWEVVGLAANGKYLVLFEPPLPHFYLPQAQNPTTLRAFLVRASVPLDELQPRIRREIEALEPDLPIADFRPLEKVLAGNIGAALFSVGAVQAGAMSVLGFVLAVIGIYGLVSYRTAQRSREIGIRMAMGAQPSDVRWLVVGQGAVLAMVGVVAGISVALVLTTMLRRVLFVSPTDPMTFAVVSVLLAGSALVACYLPARRAMRVEPIVALRDE
jgi:putative ABC transport system permease protein